LHTVFK